ncbi:MAG: hypothetical protein ACT4PP_13530 [Sporichthyaceae bacterium]
MSRTPSATAARRAPDLADASRWRRRAIFADTQAETADWIATQLDRTRLANPLVDELAEHVDPATKDASARIAERARDYRHVARTERATAALLADVWS